METIVNQVSEINQNQIDEVMVIESKKYECPVCGMDEWCGTDGCPMDPQ
jgi:hypothetical protein